MPILSFIKDNSNDENIRLTALTTLVTLCDKADFKECLDVVTFEKISNRDGFSIAGVIFSIVSIILFGIFKIFDQTQLNKIIFATCIGIIGVTISSFLIYYVLKDFKRTNTIRSKYQKKK